jgi:hypothetical protein
MARYTGSDSRAFVIKQRFQISNAISMIDTNFNNMDFEGVTEKDDIENKLDTIKQKLNNLSGEMNSCTFEDA